MDFSALKEELILPIFESQGLDQAIPVPNRESFLPSEPNALNRLLFPKGTRSYRRRVMAGEAAYAAAVAKHLAAERSRLSDLSAVKSEYDRTCQAETRRIATQHEAIDSLRQGYLVADGTAAATIFGLLLQADSSKHGLSSSFVVSPSGRKGELNVTQRVPGPEVIPIVAGYRYIKTRDSIEAIARPQPHVNRLHRSLVAQLALRTMWVMFAADEADVLTGVWLTYYGDDQPGADGDEPPQKFWSTKSALNDVIQLALDDPEAAIQALMRHEALRVHLTEQVFRQHGLPLHREILADMCLAKYPDTFESRRSVIQIIEAYPDLFQPVGAGVVQLTRG